MNATVFCRVRLGKYQAARDAPECDMPRVLCVIVLSLLAALAPGDSRLFRITVVDEETGRGVPLVELRTVHNALHVTDSYGVVAFREPGLTGRKVFFHVKSHGYEFPRDGFGYRGKALEITEGGSATLKIKRVNLAERLYRVTGGGIYRDTVLVGDKPPLREPLLNGQVFGSDSVVNAVYRGKLRWFWGDTNRPAYPLGNFNVPGATSKLPADGGLDPEAGVDLEYAVDKDGFARATAPLPGQGPTWINGLVVLKDKGGKERLFAAYVKVKGFLEVYERGLAEFDDAKGQFEKAVQFPLDAPAVPGGHPYLRTSGGVEYVYFADPFPLVRVRAEPSALRDVDQYEAFTPLEEGTRPEQRRIDRNPDGSPRYAWKKKTAPVGPAEQAKLLRAGALKPEEALLHLRDADTGKAVVAHGGSVCWNEYRKRWVLIAVESGGSTSFLGEVWYAEADAPLGPWVYARKVVTHDKYSFYNPKQHPYFDKHGGRVLFFEGTYTHTFSGNPEPTPYYDYNQVMYKLDLANPGLVLPVPVYQTKELVPDAFAAGAGGKARPVAFFAPDRPGKGTVPVYARRGEDGPPSLRVGGEAVGDKAVFHALAADANDPPATTLPLYEFASEDGKRRAYSTDPAWTAPNFKGGGRLVCRVWRSPARMVVPDE